MANSTFKCCGCKQRYRVNQAIKLPAGKFHSIDCAVTYANEKQKKQRERKLLADYKQSQKDQRLAKERIKTAGDYIKEAQAAVNAYIRIRDKGKPCISCGATYKPSDGYKHYVDAGHYRSRGSASHLRFNVLNIHGQCVKCNRYNSGNAVDYRIGLVKKIGIDSVENLENDNKPRKFTIDYLKRIKEVYKRKYKIYKEFRGKYA